MIAVTSASFSKSETLIKRLKSSFGEDIKLNLEGKKFTRDELIEFLKGCNAAIVGLDKIDRAVISKLPDLRIISKYGVGLDNIDTSVLKEYNIALGWRGGVNRTSVAEMALGFMLMLSRNLFITSNRLKRGIWNKSGGFQLTNKTIGIIGVGFIGKELVRLLKPFNCKILVNDVIEQSDYYRENGLIEVSKEEILRESDIISLHTPSLDETIHLIDYDSFDTMKNSAYLINTSRGNVVNQEALKRALIDKKIAGAAIDAYEVEPPTDMEFLELENLISTPHIGGNAKEAVEAMGMSAIENLEEFFNER